MSLPPSPYDRGVWIRLAASRNANRADAEPDTSAADCVQQFPTMSDDFVHLVRFNSAGKPQLMVAVPANEDLSQFERWMNSWGRRRDRKTLRIV